MCQKGFVCYDPTLHRTHISMNVIFFENQHYFLVSYVPPSSTMVLPSFEQQFSNLPQVDSHFKPSMVYTRRSRPRSLLVAHLISDPNMHRNHSVAASPEPLVCRSSRVFVPSDRYGYFFFFLSVWVFFLQFYVNSYCFIVPF